MDGCGTKLDLALKHSMLNKIGIDLVAMNVNDLYAGGAKPLCFMDYIAIDKMDKKKCTEVIEGIREGCKIAKCELIGGETAEMQGLYLINKMDLAGFVFGEYYINYLKNEITKNCYLYGISSSGIHSNGYTLVRELLDKGHEYPIEEVMKPTRIYTEILDLCYKYENNILGVAHITGGGL